MVPKSEHSRFLLKSNIPYSQALRLKTICSTTTEFDKTCAIKQLDRIERK